MKLSYIIVDHPESFGSFERFTAALRRVKELGYDGVEFNLTQEPGFEVDALVRFTEAIQLPIVSFLTGANYFRHGMCLSSPRAEARQRAVETLCQCVEIASRFGAMMVIGQMQGFLSDEPNRATGEARIEECLKPVVEAAERHGATIAFEPVNHLQAGFHNSLADVLALVARINSSRFKPMLDALHMNIEEKSMTEPIQRTGTDLAHFHLCESNGDVLGSGHLNFAEIFAALESIRYTRFVSVKAYRRSWLVGAETTRPFLIKNGLIRGV